MEVYIPRGICAEKIKFEIENQLIKEVEFVGGCNGSLAGIKALIEGQPVAEVANKLEGISCRNGTSCPDQLSKALQNIVDKVEKKAQ